MNKAHLNFEDILNRIQSEPGVSGVVVMKIDKDIEPNVIVHSTIFNMENAIKLANMTEKMSKYASDVVRNLDPTNELLVLRMGTKHNKHEIIVAHEQEFIVTVLQAVENQTALQPES